MDELENEKKPVTDEVRPVKKKKKRRRKKRHMRVGKMILLDLLAIGVGLLVFALFHHALDYWDIHLGKQAPTPVVVATLPPCKSSARR